MLLINTIKYTVLKCLKVRHEIDTASATIVKSGAIKYNRYKLPQGWYMLEVHPTDVGLGCTLAITTYSETECQEISGFQKIQLTNARTSKRIIHVKGRCQSICVSSNAICTRAGAEHLVLVRISPGFATRRIKAALQQVMQNGFDSYNFSSDIKMLYARYSKQCSAPSINATYKVAPTADRKPLRSVLDNSRHCKSFDILYVDKDHKPGKRSYQTPYIIITTTDTQATEQFTNTLATIVKNHGNGVCLWYTDHDHVTSDGTRIQARLKPCSNKGLLQNGNYVGPLLICTRELYNGLGGVDITLNDSSILLFLLRAFDAIEESAIKRIAHISYSLPVTHYQAPHGFYCGKHDRRAFEQYLSGTENSGYRLAAGIYPKTWMLRPQLVTPEPTVNIIIATRDRVDLLEQCVESILSITRYTNYTITIVDNDSTETNTHAYHQRMSEISRYRKIDYSGNFNFSAINNLAAAQTDAQILVLLNNDTQVLEPDWLKNIVAQLADKEIACVGTRLIYPNGLLQHAGIVTGLLGVAGHIHRFATDNDDGYGARIRLSCDVSAVTGACLGIRRTVYTELEGLDELNLKVAYNDVDLCLRARNAGYRNRYLANVTLMHHESVSRGSDDTPDKKARFRSEYEYMKSTHKSWLSEDPAWHPNFSNAHTTPLLTVSNIDATSQGQEPG